VERKQPSGLIAFCGSVAPLLWRRGRRRLRGRNRGDPRRCRATAIGACRCGFTDSPAPSAMPAPRSRDKIPASETVGPIPLFVS
jgi:hypothetical protein